MVTTNDKTISNSSWLELLKAVKYVPKQFCFPLDDYPDAGGYALPCNLEIVHDDDKIDVLVRLRYLLEKVVITIGFDLDTTPYHK